MNQLKAIKQSLVKFYKKETFLERIEEKISMYMQKRETAYKNSFAKQKKYIYVKIFIKYTVGTILALSFSTIYYDRMWSPMRPYDYTLELLTISNSSEDRNYYALDDLLFKAEKLGELDALTYTTLGNFYGKLNHCELAQTAFYFAHLKDSKVGANSDLQYETTNKTMSD